MATLADSIDATSTVRPVKPRSRPAARHGAIVPAGVLLARDPLFRVRLAGALLASFVAFGVLPAGAQTRGTADRGTADRGPADRGAAERGLPVVLEAERIQGRTDGSTDASGAVRMGRGTLRLDTPELHYDAQTGLVTIGGGGLRWGRASDRVEAQSGRLEVETSKGEFLKPRFFFGTAMSGGQASLLRLLGQQRVEILDARMTSCLADDQGGLLREPGTPPNRVPAPPTLTNLGGNAEEAAARLAAAPALTAPPKAQSPAGWELRSPRILLDLERQEGVAEQAELRVLDVPILWLPRLSFPLGEERRSGWLPPTARADTRSGFELSAPYYLNLAPNHDLTLTPSLATRRGPTVEAEARYLGDRHAGLVQAHAVPHDQQTGDVRGALYWQHIWQAGQATVATQGLRTSDAGYWKDFAHTQTFRRQTIALAEVSGTLDTYAGERIQPTLQPRLLGQSAQAQRPWVLGPLQGQAYARVQLWQALVGTRPDDAFIAPYQRSPQIGTTLRTALPWGLEFQMESEFNRFTRPPLELDLAPQQRNGQRWHALGSISRPWVGAEGWIIPRLSLNSAAYRLEDNATGANTGLFRTIPTVSADAGLNFERRTSFGERALVQTLEPRVVYVNTPMRDQRELPNFDAAPKEFNSTSIFSENAFSGIDRVSDAHQMTLGLTSRALDARTGAELLRGSIAQRVQFRDQTTTPAGTIANQRLSDVLLAATVGLSPLWGMDATLQYNPDLQRTTRSVLTLRYSPELGRTLIAAYRFARNSAETVEVRANWPLWREMTDRPGGSGQSCTLLVTGASRLNYNTRESRLADSLLGVEIDSGCWITRLGVQRQSTGVTEVVTRLILQVELSGLTRSRVNPLRF